MAHVGPESPRHFEEMFACRKKGVVNINQGRYLDPTVLGFPRCRERGKGSLKQEPLHISYEYFYMPSPYI